MTTPQVRMRRDLTEAVRLRPVLELSPGDLGRADSPTPGVGLMGEDEDADADAYWRRCLAQSGLVDARAVTESAWLIYTDDIVAPLLIRNVLTAYLSPLVDGHGRVDLTAVPALQGGFALVERGEVVLIPTCCGDLADLAEWDRISAHRGDDVELLWIGHPALSVRYEEGQLLLREEQEDGVPEAPRTVRVAPAVLAEAVRSAKADVDALLLRLLRVLADIPDIGDHAAIGNALVGRSGRVGR